MSSFIRNQGQYSPVVNNKLMRWFSNRKHLAALILVEVVLILVIGTSVLIVINKNRMVPEPPLENAAIISGTATKLAQSQIKPSATSTPPSTLEITNPTVTRTPFPSATPTPDTLCGGPPRILILALGIDNRWDTYYYGLADVIRIARVDFLEGKVTVLALPRDLWVEIPGLTDRDITHGKLNQAYLYGSEYLGYYDGPDLGPGLMLETLALNYDLDISKYVTLNMVTVAKVIDAAGGIDIYLPRDINGVSEDPPVDLGYFEKGDQHFDGETAVRFARVRMIDNDIQRSNRQSMVLKALWKKILSPAILPRIPDLVNALYDSVETNLKAKEIRQMICLAPLIADQEIHFTNLPPEMLVEDRIFVERYMKTVFYWNVDLDDLRQLLADFEDGSWPQTSP